MGTRISDLTEATYLDGTELVPIVQNGTTLRATSAQLSSPTGEAGGALSGSYPSPQIADSGVAAGVYGGSTVSPVISVLSDGRVDFLYETPIAFTPASTILPSDPGSATIGVVNAFAKADHIHSFQPVELSGAVIGSGTTSIATTLSETGVSAGTYGSTTQSPVIAVGVDGRVTSVSNASIAIPLESNVLPSNASTAAIGTSTRFAKADHVHNAQTIVFSGDITGTGTGAITASLNPSGADAGTYGSSTRIPVIVVNEKGIVTGATTSPISGTAGGTVTSITAGAGLTGGTIVDTGTIAVSYGTTAGTSVEGNDSRLSDSRTPLAHSASHASGGADPISVVASQISGSLTQNTSGTAAGLSATLAVSSGGTGGTNANAARTNLSAAAFGANTDITSVALTTGTVSTAPSSASDLVNKSYADSIGSGINFHDAANYATLVALSAAYTYSNGTSGVGATITANAVGTLTIDGYTLLGTDVGKRLLIKNETGVFSNNTTPSAAFNGIYTLTTAGTGSVPFVLTRATDYDTSGSGSNEIQAGDFILVLDGSQANSAWVQQTKLPITVGTTSIAFTQFAAAASGVSSFSAGTTGLSPSTGTAGNVTLSGTLGVANGGTGATTLTGLVKGTGTTAMVSATAGADYVVPSGNITGTAAGLSATLAVASGGTGLTTTPANGAIDIGNGTGFTRATLTAGNNVSITNTAGAISIASDQRIISVTDNSAAALRITQLGTGEALRVEDEANPDASPTVITNNGNVGIGTATPTSVNGNASKILGISGAINNIVNFTNTSTSGAGIFEFTRTGRLPLGRFAQFQVQNSADDGYFSFLPSAAGADAFEQMRIDKNGVGIGIGSPRSNLDLHAGSICGVGNISGNSNNGGYTIWGGLGASASPDGAAITLFGSTHPSLSNVMYFGYGVTELMRIAPSGNVGIGTSVPLQKLDVMGVAKATSFMNAAVVTAIGSAYTVDLSSGTTFTLTLTSGTAATITMPTVSTGQSFTLIIKQPATGTVTTVAYTGTPAIKWAGGAAPTMTATLGKADIISFSTDGTSWFGSAVKNF